MLGEACSQNSHYLSFRLHKDFSDASSVGLKRIVDGGGWFLWFLFFVFLFFFVKGKELREKREVKVERTE